VDEAYVEYVDAPEYPDASQWLDELPNLIVTRHLLEGLWPGGAARRLCAVEPRRFADLLNRVRQPFNVNSVALAAALAALDDPGYVRRAVGAQPASMAQLIDGPARAAGLGVHPVRRQLPRRRSRPAGRADRSGPAARGRDHERPIGNYGLPNHLRVTIGLPRRTPASSPR